MLNKANYVSFLKENRTVEQAQTIYQQRIEDSREVFDKFSESFYIRDCPFCGSSSYISQPPFDGRYGVAKCNSCSSLFVNPCPPMEALDYYYNNCKCNRQLGSLLKSRVGQKGIILSERTEFVLALIKGFLSYKDDIKILEVGCNSGVFLHELYEILDSESLQERVELVGIDIDKEAISKPISDKVKLHHSSAEDFTKLNSNTFDLVLHFELIEHLQNPFLFMKSIASLLSEGGKTYFHTPNILGLDNKALNYNDFRPLAHGIFPPMHLQGFSTQNIAHFILRSGLNVSDISTPGNFDIDIVKNFVAEGSEYSDILDIDNKEYLATIQGLVRKLNASSHLAVLAEK
ncbi:class I SAM-dependent methyltransferase [Neptuniibacter sp. QD48_11]|uniref:class I SAM-dependent methyltransferase n=1 Tax=unclassified Neptuniibacter TaxID=2630693 RepID=UPI0039F5C7E8